MIFDILGAIGLFASGFLSGMLYLGYITLSAYRKNPVEFIKTINEHAKKW